MTINLKAPELRELKPRIIVCGVGGGGCRGEGATGGAAPGQDGPR